MPLPRHTEPDDKRTDVQRFRDRLDAAVGVGDIAFDDAYKLLRLSIFANASGRLCNKRGLDYDEKHLAAWLHFESVKGFYLRWRRWQSAGWVTSERPPNFGRLQRLLLPCAPAKRPEPSEADDYRSSEQP